jgi:hypothetical protein
LGLKSQSCERLDDQVRENTQTSNNQSEIALEAEAALVERVKKSLFDMVYFAFPILGIGFVGMDTGNE